MAIDAGSSSRLVELLRVLEETPHQYGFYSALRRVDAFSSDVPRIGNAKLPKHERIRLGQEASVDFAGAQLSGCEPANAHRPTKISIRGFGLFGPHGPLPLHLTEYARNRARQNRDKTFGAFADIFHHRLISLFYRAWAESEPCVQRDRPGEDVFADKINALIGFDFKALQNQSEFSDESKRYFAGHLSHQNKSPSGLLAMIKETFGVETSISEFTPSWIEIPESDRINMGGMNCQLGQTAVIGANFYCVQSRFTLHLGPMSLDRYYSLLPGQNHHRQLKDLIRLYVGIDLDCEIELKLQADQIPQPRLNGKGQLGRTLWLAGAVPTTQRSVDDMHFLINQLTH